MYYVPREADVRAALSEYWQSRDEVRAEISQSNGHLVSVPAFERILTRLIAQGEVETQKTNGIVEVRLVSCESDAISLAA